MRCITLVLTVMLLPLVACDGRGANPAAAEPEACNLSRYRSDAEAIMDKVRVVFNRMNPESASSIDDALADLYDLQGDSSGVACQEDYPVKQETLRNTIQYLIDALEAAKAGDDETMSMAIFLANLNQNRFDDWSLDVD